MIHYSNGPLRSCSSSSNICRLFCVHAASQGIEAQTHYGFMFPTHRPGTAPVYKTEEEKFSKKRFFFRFHFQRMCGPRRVSCFSCLKNIRRCSKPPPVSAQNNEGRLLFWAFLSLQHLSVHLFTTGTYLPRIINNFGIFPLDDGLWI